MPLVHGLELQRVEPPLGREQGRTVLHLPQRLARPPGVDFGGGRHLERLEIEVEPLVVPQGAELLPAPQRNHLFALHDGAYQVLLVPARKDDQLARRIVHAGAHDRGVPLPAIGADEGRIGFEGVLVEVVEHEAVDAVAGERPLAPDRQQTAPVSDDFDLVGRADVVGRLVAALDGGGGENIAVLARFEDALDAAVEFRRQGPRIGSDGDTAIGVGPEDVGGQQRSGPHALAVLGRHGDDEPPDLPAGERLQDAVISAVERLQLQERIDRQREIGERGGRMSGSGRSGKFGGN